MRWTRRARGKKLRVACSRRWDRGASHWRRLEVVPPKQFELLLQGMPAAILPTDRTGRLPNDLGKLVRSPLRKMKMM